MFDVLKVGDVLIKRLPAAQWYNPMTGRIEDKPMGEVYGEVYSIDYNSMQYWILWDGGDMDTEHFWTLPKRKDMRIATKAEIVLFRKNS